MIIEKDVPHIFIILLKKELKGNMSYSYKFDTLFMLKE
jgi:hypothetical protein